MDVCLDGQIPMALLPEGLVRLIRHDRKYRTDFVSLLRLYLEHNQSLAATSRAAFMHRNTFLYKLEKIESILKLDLKDPDTALTLLVQLVF